MSYCVNCGVELERSLKKCPLCGVPVINPLEAEAPESPPAFPAMRDELKRKDCTFWIGFFSLLYVVPIIICVILNLLYNFNLTWSIYVIAGILMAWVFTTSPFYFTRLAPYSVLSIDFLGLLAGLLIIQLMAGGGNWFIGIALPIAAYCTIVTCLFIALAGKNKLNGLNLSAAISVSAAVLFLLIELLSDLFSDASVSLVWSWFVAAACISIAALLVLISHNKHFMQELAKRLHV
jgi:hypothetical protein